MFLPCHSGVNICDWRLKHLNHYWMNAMKFSANFYTPLTSHLASLSGRNDLSNTLMTYSAWHSGLYFLYRCNAGLSTGPGIFVILCSASGFFSCLRQVPIFLNQVALSVNWMQPPGVQPKDGADIQVPVFQRQESVLFFMITVVAFSHFFPLSNELFTCLYTLVLLVFINKLRRAINFKGENVIF